MYMPCFMDKIVKNKILSEEKSLIKKTNFPYVVPTLWKLCF
jgi:hypothetical protein